MIYKVTNALKTGTVKTKFGEFDKYAVQLEGETDTVELLQKPDSPALTVGQELDGTIEDTQYGKRFKKTQQAGGGFGGSRAADPATRASIERQSALKAAVEAMYNYSQVYGQDEKLSVNAYTNRIVNLTNAFAAVIAGQAVAVTPAEKAPVEEPATEQPPADQINLDDLPL